MQEKSFKHNQLLFLSEQQLTQTVLKEKEQNNLQVNKKYKFKQSFVSKLNNKHEPGPV